MNFADPLGLGPCIFVAKYCNSLGGGAGGGAGGDPNAPSGCTIDGISADCGTAIPGGLSAINEFDVLALALNTMAADFPEEPADLLNSDPTLNSLSFLGNQGNPSGGAVSRSQIKDLIHKLCDGIRSNGGGFVAYFGGTASVSFDGNGMLNGAFQQLNEDKETTVNAMGQSVTLAPNTTAGITWTNAPSQDRQFTIATNKAVTVNSGIPGIGAAINSVSFDGSFHVNGSLFAGPVPLGAGVIENKLNRNFSAVLSATDLANKLHDIKVSCEDALNLITIFSKIQ